MSKAGDALRQKFVTAAEGYLWAKQGDSKHKDIIDTYNAHKPLPRGYKVQYTDAWCATFVSALAIKCDLLEIMPTECGVEELIKLYQKGTHCAWREDENYTPKIGDLMMYDWQDTGVGDDKGYADHVGIVEKVSGKEIVVLEGNYAKSVKLRKIAVNGRYIRGYGLPDFDWLAEKQAETPELPKEAYGMVTKEVAPWAKEDWLWAKEAGLLDGTRPWDNVTRQELAVVMKRMYEMVKK